MSNFLLHIGYVSKVSRYDRLNLTPCNIEITSKYRTKETQPGLPIMLYLSQIRDVYGICFNSILKLTQ